MEAADQYRQTSSLARGDVAVDSITSPSMVKVHLKHSKCDQFGRGVDVIVGRTGSPICPVTAVLEYVRVRQDEPGPFFVSRAKTPVTKAWLVQQVRHVLRSLGLPQDDYAGHSFRIGAATSAALAGIEDSTIQALGRWQCGIPPVRADTQGAVGPHLHQAVGSSHAVTSLAVRPRQSADWAVHRPWIGSAAGWQPALGSWGGGRSA